MFCVVWPPTRGTLNPPLSCDRGGWCASESPPDSSPPVSPLRAGLGSGCAVSLPCPSSHWSPSEAPVPGAFTSLLEGVTRMPWAVACLEYSLQP